MNVLWKDAPLSGDVHVSTTGGKKKPKATISQATVLPVTGATLAAQQENPDDDPKAQGAGGAAKPFGKLLEQIRKSVDQDADEAVTSALVQVMHDCACAIGAQCRDVEGDAVAAKRDAAPAGGADGWSIPFKVAKADAEQGLVFGWASVVEKDGALVIDKQGDAILPADLEKAAYDFVLTARQHGDMHQNIGTGQCVESMVFTKDKQAALGVDLGLVGWWVGFKIHDADTRAAIKRGELPEFSIGGSGRRVEME